MNSRPAWVRELPASRMVFPTTLSEQCKYLFWRFFTPIHPYFRDLFLELGIMRHEGRQDFLIGHVAPGETVEGLAAYLVSKGYGNHFIAWRDQGEVVGLRYLPDFKHQYHIRIFEDGEVRAHYEYTPECNPILHLRAEHQEDCRDEVMNVIGDKIVALA